MLRTIVITLFAFGVYFIVDENYFRIIRGWINEQINQLGFSHIIAYIIVGIPIVLGTILIHRNNKILENWGLNKGIMKAFAFALLCTLPMFVGYMILSKFNADFSFNSLLITVISAAFFEELYFRGFLFGQIYRYTKWGFIPSVIIGAVLFGLVHLYQGTEIGEIIGIFLITFLGGILYAWVFVEWNYNLWVPIFLHLLMNLSWGLFSVGENALGGLYANVFRVATITLIIVLTIIYKRRIGENLRINKNSIWMKKIKTGYNKNYDVHAS